MSPPVTVLVAERRALFRKALRGAIDDEADLTTVAEAATSEATLREVQRQRIDVVVIDSALEPTSGADVCAALKSAGLPTRVLVLGDEDDQNGLQAAVEAGADGYLTRSCGVADVLAAIRRVHAGEASIPPGMLGSLLRSLIQRRREEDAVVARFAKLSRREREVLSLLVEGYDQQDIAASLFLSKHTARTHIQNVLEKLAVHSRLEAVALVREHNLVERFGTDEDGAA